MSNGQQFDVVILGGGSGGYATALRAAQLDLSVALIEKDKLGGTCLHRGCIPTKALLHAGEVADQTRESEQFGIKAELVGIDMAGVNAYKDGVVARLYKGLQGLVSSREDHLRRGRPGGWSARPPSRSDGQRYTGRNVVLATGSYSRTPARPGDRRRAGHHLRARAARWTGCRRSAIVLGGGVIGVEFASVWRSFGADVTIVEALPRLVAAEDEECSKALERAFRKRGIAFKVGKPFEKVERTETGVRVTIAGGETIEAELLLVAVGRGPTTAEPRLRGAGRRDGPRLRARPTSGCAPTCPDVYAVGDIVPGLQLAHRGFQQGIFVAEEIAGLNPAADRRDRHPAGHLLRPGGRLDRPDRGARPRSSTAPTR